MSIALFDGAGPAGAAPALPRVRGYWAPSATGCGTTE